MSSSPLPPSAVGKPLLERVEALEARIAAIRDAASTAGRPLTDDEREQIDELLIERVTAYREWQQERNRVPSPIITGKQIFRKADARR